MSSLPSSPGQPSLPINSALERRNRVAHGAPTGDVRGWQRVWRDVRQGQNLDVYLMLIAALVLVVCQILGYASMTLILAAISGILAVMLQQMLASRIATERLTKAVELSRENADPSANALLLGGYPVDLDQFVQDKAEISVLTVTCTQIRFQLLEDLSHHLKVGGKLRVLTVRPEAAIFGNVVCFGEDGNVIEQMVANHATILRNLKTAWKQFIQTAHCEIRELPHVPPYRIMLARDRRGHREVVWLPRPLSVTGRKFLAVHLADPNHSLWIDYLQSQFDAVWDATGQASEVGS